jgi:hypothetical protein
LEAGFIGQNRAAAIIESITPLFSEQGTRASRATLAHFCRPTQMNDCRVGMGPMGLFQ